MYGLMFFIIVKLVVAFIKEMMRDEKPVLKQIMYKINGKPSNISMQHYYIQLLGLSDIKVIDNQVVSNAYNDKLSYVDNRQSSGEKNMIDLDDLNAAKAYLNDACNYMGAKN